MLEITEVYEAITEGKKVNQSGEWGMATLEVILAAIKSSTEHTEITLSHQCPSYM